MKKILINPPFVSPQRNGKFHNFSLKTVQEPAEWLYPSIKMYIDGKRLRQNEYVNLSAWIEPYRGYDCATSPIITWLGHASMLIQMGGVNILTDPIVGSPSFLYKRVLPFGAEFTALPHIDVVLISHNHRDHMDTNTLRALHKEHDPLFLVPCGDALWFKKRGITKVEEHLWWEALEHKGVLFSFVPAWHWSQRGLLDHNSSLWGGWVMESKTDTVYFAGDSAYSEHYFKAIGERFPEIEIAIMPIGPCDPDHWMRKSHMSAQEAGQAFLDCGGKYFIPMHWGTFCFGTDLFSTPIERLTGWWSAHQEELKEQVLCLNKLGQQFHLEHHKGAESNILE